MIRAWLRKWLGIEDVLKAVLQAQLDHGAAVTHDFNNLQGQIDKLRAELAQLRLERYVPPATPEPERKIIKTRNWREFTQILDQEQEAEENNAFR